MVVNHPICPGLVLTPVSRRPIRLPNETIAAILAVDAASPVAPIVPRQQPARRVTIVVPTVDNLVFLKLCLTSILANTGEPEYELLVVDNASVDGTAAYLSEIAGQHPHVRTIRNHVNRGFAQAINQGFAAARGSVFVALNDDTIVPPGWLGPMCHHLDDPTVGLLGPVTNRAGNESQIEVAYRTYGEFLRLAGERMADHRGESRDIPMLTMFCVAMRREVFERIGPLDEQFAVGMFEDDDYSMRVRRASLRVVCAEDVFLHHFGGTSIGKLAAAGGFGSLFEDNRQRFEKKWQIAWSPHQRRDNPEYDLLVARIREVVRRNVREGSVVAVISRGDDALLSLPGCMGCHLPQAADGTYAGYHPAGSTAAIAQLEAMRFWGAGYLLIPERCRWWLDQYVEFRQHVEKRYRRVIDEAGTCIIFDLHKSPVSARVWIALEQAITRFQRQHGRAPAILDWNTGLNLAARLPREAVFLPPTRDPRLPYLDQSVDIVAVASPDAGVIREANRVAAAAVLRFTGTARRKQPDLAMVAGWKAGGIQPAVPSVSILIRCVKSGADTKACLEAVRETLPDDIRCEIIVVDDGCSDGHIAVEFSRSCYRAAQAAKGEFLVFLISDMIPLPGWLPPLLCILSDRPDAGAVGGKLVRADGTLDQAGGVIFRDGSAVGFGCGDVNPDQPLYNYVREVDYCSGAFLATRRALFTSVGVDLRYHAACYEGADYCFKLRAKGYRAYYQPESAAIHLDRVAAGCRDSPAPQRCQSRDQSTFIDRWNRVLERRRVAPDRFDFTVWHALALRDERRVGDAR